MSNRAIFLDRDGVLNPYLCHPEFGTIDSPAHPDEFSLFPGVPEAIARLRKLGFMVIVTSNQPGIAKGRFSRQLLEATTEKMKHAIAGGGGKLDAVYYCLHHPEASVAEYRAVCACRKPKPGLLLQAARELDIALDQSFMIGDGVTDVLAGQAAGASTILISTQRAYVYDELQRHAARPDFVTSDLSGAVELIAANGTAKRFAPAEMPAATYTAAYVNEAAEILKTLDQAAIERTVDLLREVRERGGRVFFLGVGGGAGHASHAVCDFRKIAGLEAYAPTDNVSELTARINDDGWDTSYLNWLRGSRLGNRDLVFVFSVGGGDREHQVSMNLVHALEYARQVGARICGVVGRSGGFTAQVADSCVLVRVPNPATVTPHTESFQAMVWHLLVSHPRLKAAEMKWESLR